MFKLRNKKSQVILETVLVFVAMALLLAGSVRLFTKLNQSMLERYQTYRDSRYRSVNSLVQGIGAGMNPKDYLKFDPERSGGFIMPIMPGFSGEITEARINQAEIKLREMDNIMNVILPHKVLQIYDIAQHLVSGAFCVRTCGIHFIRCCEWVYWGPAAYGIEIQKLCNEAISRASIAVTNIDQAKQLLQSVLSRPTQYSPYDPVTCNRNDINCADPRLPKCESPDCDISNPADRAKFSEEYQRAYDLLWYAPDGSPGSIPRNREQLAGVINSLDSVKGGILAGRPHQHTYIDDDGEVRYSDCTQAHGGLYDLLYNAAVPTNAYPGYQPLPGPGLIGRLAFILNNILQRDRSLFIGHTYPHTNAMYAVSELIDFVGMDTTNIPTYSALFTQQVQTVCYTDLGYDAVNRTITSAPTRSRIQHALGIASAWRGLPDLTHQAADSLAEELDYVNEEFSHNPPDQPYVDFHIGLARMDAGALYEVTQTKRRGNYP